MSILLTAIVCLWLYRLISLYYERKHIPEHYGDDLTHLSIVKEYKRTGGKPLDLSWLYPLGAFDYPSGFHKIVYWARPSMSWLERFGGIIPTIFDSILLVAAYLLLLQLEISPGYWFVALPLCRTFFAHDGRSIHFGERAFGILFGNLYLLCLVSLVHFETGVWVHIVAIAMFLLFSTSSKFAWQATFFFTIGLSLAYSSWTYLLFYFCHFLLATLLSGGYSVRVLKGLVRHSFFYKTVLIHKHPTVKDHYVDLFLHLTDPTKTSTPLINNSLVRTILDFPLLIGAMYCIVLSPLSIWASITLIGLALTLLTAWKPLGFLGEPERYLDFTLLPSLVVFLSDLALVPLYVQSLIAVVVVFAFASHFIQFRKRCVAQKNVHSYLPLMREWFVDIKSSTILPIPFRYGLYVGYSMLPECHNQILTLHANIGEGVNYTKYTQLLGVRYPYPDRDIDKLIQEFKIDYLLVDKAAVAYLHKEFPGYYERFNKYSIVRESPIFMLVKP